MKTSTLPLEKTQTAIPSTWTIDAAHTKIQFGVRHLVISEVTGHFDSFDGKIQSTMENFENSQVDININTNSVNTGIADRDTHLKSVDFFESEKFPAITFHSTAFKQITDDKYKMSGDFTIKNITKNVEFDVTYNGTVTDPWGNTKAGFQLNGTINRFDFDLKWNTVMEAGGALVGKNVNITCNVELTLVKN